MIPECEQVGAADNSMPAANRQKARYILGLLPEQAFFYGV